MTWKWKFLKIDKKESHEIDTHISITEIKYYKPT